MKRFLILALAFCLLFGAALCEETETLMDRVLLLVEDATDLVVMGDDDLFDLIGIDPADCEDYVYLASADAISGRELIVVIAKDDDAADLAEEMLQAYLESRLRETRNYFPEAYQALTEAEVVRQDRVLILSVAAPSADEAQILLPEE